MNRLRLVRFCLMKFPGGVLFLRCVIAADADGVSESVFCDYVQYATLTEIPLSKNH